MSQKTTTIRVSEERAEELEVLAQVEGVPVSEVIRTAIDELIEAKRADEGFQERLRDAMDRNRAVLRRLAQA